MYIRILHERFHDKNQMWNFAVISSQSVEVEAAVRSAVPRWSPSHRHRRCPWTTSLPTDRSANKWSSVCYNSVHRFSGYETISFCADLSSRARTAACERWWSNGGITRIILHPPRTRSSRILHTNKLGGAPANTRHAIQRGEPLQLN